jgi:hypothetical protein
MELVNREEIFRRRKYYALRNIRKNYFILAKNI